MMDSIACFSLEEYQTAKSAFVAGAALEPKNPSFKTWISKCDAELSGKVTFFCYNFLI
jgi:hypothetical protein